MNEKDKVAKVATPKVIEKVAKVWGTLSPAEKDEFKAKLPLSELYAAVLSRGFDMLTYIVRTNVEAAKSEVDDKRAELEFYKSQLNIEGNEDRRRDLEAKIDHAFDQLTRIYAQARKDRLGMFYAVVAGLTIVGSFVALAKNGKIPK